MSVFDAGLLFLCFLFQGKSATATDGMDPSSGTCFASDRFSYTTAYWIWREAALRWFFGLVSLHFVLLSTFFNFRCVKGSIDHSHADGSYFKNCLLFYNLFLALVQENGAFHIKSECCPKLRLRGSLPGGESFTICTPPG